MLLTFCFDFSDNNSWHDVDGLYRCSADIQLSRCYNVVSWRKSKQTAQNIAITVFRRFSGWTQFDIYLYASAHHRWSRHYVFGYFGLSVRAWACPWVNKIFHKLLGGISPNLQLWCTRRQKRKSLDFEVRSLNFKFMVMTRPSMSKKGSAHASTACRRVLSSFFSQKCDNFLFFCGFFIL